MADVEKIPTESAQALYNNAAVSAAVTPDIVAEVEAADVLASSRTDAASEHTTGNEIEERDTEEASVPGAKEDIYSKPVTNARDVREQLLAIAPPEFSAPDDTPDDGREPIIFLDNIYVTFKTRTGSLIHPNKVKAVQGITIKLMPGECIGIVGESGCGKSTTANVLCGLQSPTSGHVYFKGRDVTKRTAADRKAIGRVVSVVFQDPATALNARMSIHDQLLDPMIVHKVGTAEEREARVKELIGLVGLPESCLAALPGQLSGGQRQRVAIARALSINPEVIIADEPTSALDVSVRAQILNLLMDLKRELNLSMVFISHDISTVRYISDRIIVMNKGMAVERGTTEQIFYHAKEPYTKLLLGATPSLLNPDESAFV